MRIYADVNRLPNVRTDETSSVIIQAGPTPEVGTATPINGKFVLDVPDNIPFPKIDENSRLINQSDPGYFLGDIYSNLVKTFPGYNDFIFNQLWISTDLERLDPAATFPYAFPLTWSSRFQSGSTSVPKGVAPGSVALLPENTYVTPHRPGLIVTANNDIAPYTGGGGRSDFVVYWKVYRMETTEDVMDYSTGDNVPASRNLIEIDQDAILAYISANNGTDYVPVTRLSPATTSAPGTDVRIAFVNHNPYKVYLAAYSVMF